MQPMQLQLGHDCAGSKYVGTYTDVYVWYLKRISSTGIQNVTVDIPFNCIILCQNNHLPFLYVYNFRVYLVCARCFEVTSAIEIGIIICTS